MACVIGRSWWSGVALVLAAGGAHAQLGQSYEIELQIRSSLDPNIPAFNAPALTSISSQPTVIDGDGRVAIRAFVNQPGVSEAILSAKGGVGSNGTGVVVTGFSAADLVWGGDISLRGGVVGVSGAGFVDPAFTYDAETGDLLNTFDAANSAGVTDPSGLTGLAGGALCYRGDFGFAGDKIVIDRIDAMGVRTTREVADSFSGEFSFLLSPEANDAEQVVFNSIPASGSGRRIVRVEPDGTRTTIAATGAPAGPAFDAFVNSTGIAQDGGVAFSGRAAGIWGVYWSDGTDLVQIASGDDPQIVNSNLANFPPVASNGGVVAFRVEDATTDSTSLFVGDGQTLVKVAAAGQVVETDLGPLRLGFDFGPGTGVQTINSNIDINENGQIGFAAFLENGTIGVFVATPVADCPPDLNGDGSLTGADFNAFIAAFVDGDLQADLNGDGMLTGADFNSFIGQFVDGCD